MTSLRWALAAGLVVAACSPSSTGGSGSGADAASDVAIDTGAVDVPAVDAGVDTGTFFVDVPVVFDPDAPRSDVGDVPEMDAGPRGDGGPLPNLIPVIRNPQIQARTFSTTACEVVEACTVAGNRRLLRFDLYTPNVGEGDLYFGSPTAMGRPLAMFEYGECHRHYHLRGYAEYRLFDGEREVGMGHKQSFCLLDSGRWMNMGEDLPASGRYNCGNQGIHAGWYDLYGRSLDCQYVDITGVPPGRYRVRARINVERVVEESDYSDNEAWLDVTIPPESGDGGVSMDPTLACPGEDTGVDRDCGWTPEASSHTCTPGARVAVGCNAGCSPPIGSCDGDPMIRVCEGDRPCTYPTQLAGNDDSCAPDGGRNVCASTSFTCPASGRYLVMTGAYRAGGAYECRVETR